MTDSNPAEAYFDQTAGQWDALRTGYFGDAVREVAIARAYLHPEMEVADVGAGTGFMASELAPRVRKVHLLDGSEAMLRVARQNLAQYGNLEFHRADGLALPLPEASQDAVFANMVLRHCPEPLKAIQEMVRILRPGGRLVITDLDAHDHERFRAEMADLWLGFERAQVRRWFAQAGLVNVIVDGAGEGCRAEASPEADSAAVSVFVAVGTRRILARQAVQASYAAAAQGTGCDCTPGADCCAPAAIPVETLAVAAAAFTPAVDVTAREAVSQVAWDGGYTAADKAEIPAEAADFSLGCGNPLAMASLQPGETVLDIGSGGGLDAFIAAKRVGPAGQVIGVDMTPAMLQRARRAAQRGGFTNVKFRRGYAEKLPLPANAVDVIISNCVINLAEDKGQVFREAFRVLRPGGRLEINDMVFGGGVLPAQRASAPGWAGCVSGALPEQEYLDLVKQAGFSDVTARRSTSAGVAAGVAIYSVQVSARKEAAD